MKKLNEICFVVQARLSSQRIPGKMLKPFSNTTLMDILLKKLEFSKIIKKKNIYLSVYEKKLKLLAKKYNLKIFNRSKKSANSEGEKLTTIYEWHNNLPYKYVILISACNPFLKISTIDKFIKNFLMCKKDGSFAVFKKKNYYWNKKFKSITDWKNLNIMNTKYVDPVYEAAHCLYASRLDIIKKNLWMDNKVPAEPNLFPISEFEALDIDYPWQFKIYEKIYESIKKK